MRISVGAGIRSRCKLDLLPLGDREMEDRSFPHLDYENKLL